MAIRSKVIASERLKIAAVMAGRECVGADDEACYSPANDVRQLLEQCDSQAEFLAKLPSLIRTLYDVTLKLGHGTYQFTIALWNAVERRPEAYVIGSPGHTFRDLPPFTVAGIRESVMPRVDRSLWPAGDELTREEALAIIEEQRRSREPDGSCHVGGYAELTTVDAAGVRTETLCRWRDRIGRKVATCERRCSPIERLARFVRTA